MRRERKGPPPAARLLLLVMVCVSGIFAHAQGSPLPDRWRAVLDRGNRRVRGIPGFGANAFEALYGSYRLEDAGAALDPPGQDPAGGPAFSVWVTRAPLYLEGEGWRNRPGLSGLRARDKAAGAGLLVAAALGSGGEPLTAVFEFSVPAGTDPQAAPPEGTPGLPEGLVNRLLSSWVSRFNYFYSLIKTPGDMSLPAVVVF
jgi:hypothetical protein